MQSMVSGPFWCWTYITSGLSALGQKEMVFTLKRRTSTEREQDFQTDIIEWFSNIYTLAQNEMLVDDWGQSRFYRKGFLGRDDIRLLLYSPPLDIRALPPGAMPEERLHIIPATAPEADVVHYYCVMRFISQLGKSERWFPVHPWFDRDRQHCVTTAQMKGTIRSAFSFNSVGGVSVFKRGSDLVVYVPHKAAHHLKSAMPAQASIVFGLDSYPYNGSDSGMTWTNQDTVYRAYGAKPPYQDPALAALPQFKGQLPATECIFTKKSGDRDFWSAQKHDPSSRTGGGQGTGEYPVMLTLGDLEADEQRSCDKCVVLARGIRSYVSSTDKISAKFPARVLDLGIADEHHDIVHLVETPSKRGQFGTLSHCWSSGETITTTLATLESRRGGIALTDLPRSFQNAILLFRKLGVRYIWVDSLCIIQDDEADWQAQAAQIESIFSNSSVTIAVADDGGCTPGCFLSEPPNLPSRTVRWPGVDGEGSYRTSVGHSSEHTPLLRTGAAAAAGAGSEWVHPERRGSKRILYVGKTELLWECKMCSMCECGYQG
ncbi:hypothetical protein NEMBOFW57_005642 [Staphylotrichum longicolle]|uniref:Heterokaryon incompatibility domain-containing protein n=1 Tax=Staphylotrichum longicolle TaxID=669026 RepID=A0AAD4HZW3_9PEZI|nr:hypothetical protein NEMBOFW57_005642 [Staphylotrichum longicolle]